MGKILLYCQLSVCKAILAFFMRMMFSSVFCSYFPKRLSAHCFLRIYTRSIDSSQSSQAEDRGERPIFSWTALWTLSLRKIRIVHPNFPEWKSTLNCGHDSSSYDRGSSERYTRYMIKFNLVLSEAWNIWVRHRGRPFR